MLRLKTAVSAAVGTLLIVALAGCAGRAARPGEPSPKETPAATEAAPSEPVSPAAPAVEPAAPLVLSDKPRIVAKVEWAQMPVWVERGGVKAAVKPGWAIYTSDRITTGTDGRALLATIGEGQLKIGGNADIAMTPAYEANGGPDPSVFKVQRGSITLTAPMVRTGVPGLLVEVGDGIDANVLGGSIYAQSNGDEDLLALIEGVVEVSGDKLNPGSMKTDGTFLRVPHAGRAQPVNEAGGDKFARWLSAAEPVKGRPVLDAAGAWDVSLNSGYNLPQLEAMACQVQSRGYPSEIYPVREPGKQVWYRVVVRRFKTREDAVDFLGTAKSLGAKEPWVLIPAS